jgi:hypothetical protein
MRNTLCLIAILLFTTPALLLAQRGGGGGFHGGGFHGGGSHGIGVSGGFGPGGSGYGPYGFNAFGPTQPTAYGSDGFGRFGRGRGRGFGGRSYAWPWYGGGAWGYGGLDDLSADWDYVDFPPTNYAGSSDYAGQEMPQQTASGSVPETRHSRYIPPPVSPPQLIEIPLSGKSAPAKPEPPALFVLNNGTRIETKRYFLTAKSLSVEVAHRQRTIPLSDLDIDATIAANQQRGLDLNIPSDCNSVFVSF